MSKYSVAGKRHNIISRYELSAGLLFALMFTDRFGPPTSQCLEYYLCVNSNTWQQEYEYRDHDYHHSRIPTQPDTEH